MMCSNSSTKHSTIMKHLHREKCSHLHLRVSVCAPKRVCPVCLQCDAEWKKRPYNNTHGNTDKQTHDTKNEKMNVMWSQKYMKYIRCFMRYSRFRVFVLMPSQCYGVYVWCLCMAVCTCFCVCMRVCIKRSFFYAFHLHVFFRISLL